MNTQQLWQAQALDAPRISLAFVRHQADALQRRTRIINAVNYVVGGVGMAYFAWKSTEFFSTLPLLSAATVLWLSAALLATLFMRRRSASQQQPAEFGVLDALKFHRQELERQRDARRGVGRWLPLFFIPGHVMLFVSFFVEVTPIPWKYVVFNAVLIVFGTWIATAMTARGARRIQKEIDALNSL
ncbi:MAG: hypothetical protein H7Y89_01715 [Steroidobacteraceae bacterium]|nr:hypothetical protein [Steroidobacteraceae bacterium]